MNQQWYRTLGIGVTAVAGALLFGITKIIDVEISTNLFQTGITPGIVFGILLLITSYLIYKNKI